MNVFSLVSTLSCLFKLPDVEEWEQLNNVSPLWVLSCASSKSIHVFCPPCWKLNWAPRLEITCKWNKNCTEKIMVPLKFLRKRSSRFGATCWGITTHQANRADGLCKYCKGLPHPPAHASLWVVIPQHVAPNLELLFPNYFSGTYGISVQFFFDWPIFSNGVLSKGGN